MESVGAGKRAEVVEGRGREKIKRPESERKTEEGTRK